MKKAAALAVTVMTIVGASALPAAAATRAHIRRPGPLRVLLVGDSITKSYQDEAAASLRAKGYVVTLEGFPGRSLLDVNMCKAGEAHAWLDVVDPDVVVFQAIGNYGLLTGGGIPPCSPPVVSGSKAFFRKWKSAASLNQRTLTKRRARFLWILNPVTSPVRIGPAINDVYRSIAGAKAGLVDAWTAFGGSAYNPAFHVADGTHLNQTGQDKLASLVVTAVG